MTIQIPVLFLVRPDDASSYDGPVSVRGAKRNELKFFSGRCVVRLEEFLEQIEFADDDSERSTSFRRIRGPLQIR